MRLVATLVFLAAAGVAAPALAQPGPPAAIAPPAPAAVQWRRYLRANEVQLRDVAAIVRVVPENRTDVAIAITPGRTPTPQVRVSGDRLVVDGGLRRQIRSCRGGQNFEVTTARYGRLSGADLTRIEVRVPQHAVVAAGGAVQLRVAPAQSATIRVEGCGDADIERVADEAEISVSGQSDVRLYEAGAATIAVAGAGDVTLGAIHEGLTASLAGAGDLTAAHVDGPTNISVQGAGDVTIRDGRATTLSVVIVGAGDFIHQGSAERLDAVILGGGDVRVHRVDGQVNRRVLGGGDVIIGR